MDTDPDDSKATGKLPFNPGVLRDRMEDVVVGAAFNLRKLGGVGWALYTGFFDTKIYKRYADRSDAEYQRKRHAEIDARHPGVGLKSYELDRSLFSSYEDYAAIDTGTSPLRDSLKAYYELHRDPEVDDPWGVMPREDRDDNVFVAMMKSTAVNSRASRELDAYVQEFKPLNTFFTPEMVHDALKDSLDVTVTEEDTPDGLHIWTFQDTDGKKIMLSRGDNNGSSKERAVPYLAVLYKTEYDWETQELVTNPELWLGTAIRILNLGAHEGDTNLSGTLTDSLLARTIVERLKLPVNIRRFEPIEFRVVGAKPDGYMRLAEPGEHTADSIAPFALESVMAQSHVIADLPKARKEELGLAKQVLPSQRPE